MMYKTQLHKCKRKQTNRCSSRGRVPFCAFRFAIESIERRCRRRPLKRQTWTAWRRVIGRQIGRSEGENERRRPDGGRTSRTGGALRHAALLAVGKHNRRRASKQARSIILWPRYHLSGAITLDPTNNDLGLSAAQPFRRRGGRLSGVFGAIHTAERGEIDRPRSSPRTDVKAKVSSDSPSFANTQSPRLTSVTLRHIIPVSIFSQVTDLVNAVVSATTRTNQAKTRPRLVHRNK